jgi:flagellar hook protein FlgE
MGSAYLTALTGLQSNSSAINIAANNLANIDATGFKSQTATFSDLLASEMDIPGMTTALGTSEPLALNEFQQGQVETAQGPLDAAISNNPNGFFVTQSANGAVYTRAGDFQLGNYGAGNTVLLSQTGNAVQGYKIGANGQVSATMGLVILPTQNNPAPTSLITVQANLDSTAAAGAQTSFSQTIDAADGTTHTLTLNFTRGATPGAWTLTAQVDGQATPGSEQVRFNAQGQLTSPGSFDINYNGQTIAMPLTDANGNGMLTQYDSPSAVAVFGQNGTDGSPVTGYEIADGGLVTAQCADGSTVEVAQLAVATVGNPDSMTALGSGDYKVTPNTMGYKALSSANGAAPYFGNALDTNTQITGSAIEQSTTNMSTQLTNLMVYQQAYAANSKMLVTNDQMQQDVIQLIT